MLTRYAKVNSPEYQNERRDDGEDESNSEDEDGLGVDPSVIQHWRGVGFGVISRCLVGEEPGSTEGEHGAEIEELEGHETEACS